MFSKRFVIIGISMLLSLPACDNLDKIREKISSSVGQKHAPVAASPAAQKAAEVTSLAPAQDEGNDLVQVDGWRLSKEAFDEKINALKQAFPDFNTGDRMAVRQILDRLIEQRLFVAEAERRGLDKDKNFLMAMEEFRNNILLQMVVGKISEGLTVSDQEVEEYYKANVTLFVNDGQWRVREIVVPTEEEANGIATALAQGGDFAQLARDKSQGATAAEGGDLGFLTQFTFPEMASAVLALNVGSVSRPVPGPAGYYIFKLEEKKGGEPMSLELIREPLKEELLRGKQEQAAMAFLEELRKKATININENLLAK